MRIHTDKTIIAVGGFPLLCCKQLTFQRGKVHCIRGRSGTGKSTLVRALAEPESSVLLGNGFNYIQDDSDGCIRLKELELGRQVIVVQQVAPLWPHLSAISNTWIPWASRDGIRKTFRRRLQALNAARDWLSRLGLDETIWSRNPYSLSGGERQRVALASALVFDVPFLLLDEPTSSLDQTSAELVVGVINEQAQLGKLVIVTSHDADLLKIAAWRHLAIVENENGESKFMLKEVDDASFKRYS